CTEAQVYSLVCDVRRWSTTRHGTTHADVDRGRLYWAVPCGNGSWRAAPVLAAGPDAGCRDATTANADAAGPPGVCRWRTVDAAWRVVRRAGLHAGAGDAEGVHVLRPEHAVLSNVRGGCGVGEAYAHRARGTGRRGRQPRRIAEVRGARRSGGAAAVGAAEGDGHADGDCGESGRGH